MLCFAWTRMSEHAAGPACICSLAVGGFAPLAALLAKEAADAAALESDPAKGAETDVAGATALAQSWHNGVLFWLRGVQLQVRLMKGLNLEGVKQSTQASFQCWRVPIISAPSDETAALTITSAVGAAMHDPILHAVSGTKWHQVHSQSRRWLTTSSKSMFKWSSNSIHAGRPPARRCGSSLCSGAALRPSGRRHSRLRSGAGRRVFRRRRRLARPAGLAGRHRGGRPRSLLSSTGRSCCF